MDKQIAQWLGDYVVMMEANLGALQNSKIPGLYDSIVQRVVEVRMRLKSEGYNVESPFSAGGNSDAT